MILAYGDGSRPSSVLNNSKKKKRVKLAKFAANPRKKKAVNQLKASIKKAKRAQA